ncbi:hypothetical protein SAMN05880501_101268 [Ureibacillus xyleni]|uniref:Uncharacterized protein n=1 Tax=Ureibacillus xyleni TaxID=614648 RepID=A0A285RBK2_9BACL|nr:hypothetical protein [Ureibacillus xyleni]SOB91138.1 hypothetical protein SAMN05880501_101268 [Ureibacillus xyleni]
MKKFIFFGASKLGELAYFSLKDKIEISYFSDNDETKWGSEYYDIPIISPYELQKIQKGNKEVNILITSSYHKEIYLQLKNMGLNNIQIFDIQSSILNPDEVNNGKQISEIFFTKYGIKSNNKLFSSTFFNKFKGKKVTLKIDDLNLGIDGLNDKYTLAYRKVQNSPHYELMLYLHNNWALQNCEYIKRLSIGTLDLREAQIVNDEFLDYTREKYEERVNLLNLELLEPIKVAKINNNWFIIDGKHRAALHCLRGYRTINAVEVTEIMYDSFNFWIYKLMKNKEAEYKKNLSLFEGLYY